MKIICQSCQSKYNVADEKVQGKTVKIRCRKCGATIVVSGNGAAAEPAAALGPAAGPAAGVDGEGPYHVNVSDGDQRTMSIPEIVQAYNTGVINQETYLWTDGMDDWLPLAQVDAIVGALNAAAMPHAPMGGPDAATVETAAAAASAHAPMAAQPEAKRAAVVRREGRANRDLFGGGGGELAAAQDVQTSAPMFASGAAIDSSGGGATGQRNENSVLFSLAALTSIAAQPQGSAGGGAIKDDSGLIDLKAMTAAATTAKRISEVPAAPLFPVASPFGAEQPILAAPSDAPQARNRLPLFIGLGAGAFAVLATIGIVIIVKLSATKPVEVIEVPAAVSTAPVASAPPEETASATSTAAPPSTASPSTSVAKNTSPRPRSGSGARPGGAPAAPGAAPAAPPKPPAAHGSCGCSGDDLMCQIKCAAGKH